MSSGHDIARLLQTQIARAEKLLEQHEYSIGWSVWDGPALGLERCIDEAPEGLAYVGGIYDALAGKYVGRRKRPVLQMQLAPQQLAPMQSTAKSIAIVGGERSGKTETAMALVIKRMLEQPGYVVFAVVPTYKMAPAIEAKFRSKIPPGWIAHTRASEWRYTLHNGSVFRIYSASDHGQSFKGDEASLVWINEARQVSEETLLSAYSRVPRTQSVLLDSSPEVGHWLEDVYLGRYAQAFEVHHLHFQGNFWQKRPEDPDAWLRTAKRIYDPAKYARDVEGQFVSAGGQDYYNFNRDRHAITDLTDTPCTEWLWQSEVVLRGRKGKPPNWRYRVVVGMDFGTQTTATVAFVAAVDTGGLPATPDDVSFERIKLIAIAEHQEHGTNTADYVRSYLKPTFPPEHTIIICDPSGTNRSQADGQTSVNVLRRFGYQVLFWPRDRVPPKLDTIDSVRSLLHRDALLFKTSCPQTIEAMGKARTLTKSQDAASRDPYGHLTDCVRYVAGYLLPYSEMLNPGSPAYGLLQGD